MYETPSGAHFVSMSCCGLRHEQPFSKERVGVLGSLGRMHHRRKDYDAARPLMEELLATARREPPHGLGPEHPQTVRSIRLQGLF